MTDNILQKFFEPARWHYAIAKGVDKDINKGDLFQLTKSEVRLAMCQAIVAGEYEIAPPHTAKIPKDNGEFRTVYINEPIDRVLLSIANDLLFELTPEMIHPSCRSYQKGIGCGKIVKDVSAKICNTDGEVIGWKSDLSKYFDSVPLRFVEEAFDKVEAKYGHSALIDVLRKYYRSDWYFDTDGQLRQSYQSLKQGCSVASWLANVLLHHIDEQLAGMDGYYVRYSDDMLFVGNDYQKAMNVLQSELSAMGMKLNPKKVEYLTHDRWFKFLGFSIKGAMISLSSTRIKKFQKEIERRTIKAVRKGCSYRKAINSVNNFLYKGDGEHSWASQILSVCNVTRDIAELNKFVMDCLRAVHTKKLKVGGLGYMAEKTDGCIARGSGRNVRANRQKLPGEIDRFLTLSCMQNVLHTSREAYKVIVAGL